MPRTARYAPGGIPFHILNRGVGRMTLFETDDDFSAFERILERTLQERPMRVCGYCLLSTHWHFVLWPERNDELADFMQKLTVTHVTRWCRAKSRVGLGHVYQGRYKSFPVQDDEHFYHVMRYVERNALRAGLCRRAEDWRWGSLWRYYNGTPTQKQLLSPWPVARPRFWRRNVNEPQSDAEVEAIRHSVLKGRPLGQPGWIKRMADRLGLQHTLRNAGRPRKPESS